MFSKHGEPLLGLDKFVRSDLPGLLTNARVDYVLAPNSAKPGDVSGSGATQHGAFDDDEATVQGTLARILGSSVSGTKFSFARSAQSTREKRVELLRQARISDS